MYQIKIFLAVFFIFVNLSFAQKDDEKQKEVLEQNQQLVVYEDKDSAENHFYPSEWIADSQDLELDDACKDNPHSGDTCIRVKYKAKGSFGWAGIYWVNPKGNWGNLKGGYDLRFAKKLTFWASGEKGGEHIAVFRFGGIKGIFSDSDIHGLGPVVLTKEWKQYEIDVSSRNMRYISTGFGFALTKAHNKQGCVFYLDDIKYE
ncbi:MAG: hypothetical protein KJ893_06775 [Candidatus Omnitrophica bacterium]|nr:hypothetical protein [Candidatus Omnitrophota bacterium]MCG2703747.1 hypothetical protein [Candidatus Omnitrophota bacterium]